jgi:hypothetical protein
MPKTMLGGTCELGASRTRWQKQEPSPSLTRLRHVSARFRAGGGRLIPFVPAHCILLRLIPPPLRFRLHFIASAPFHSAVQNCDETAGRPARKKAAREPSARARPSISTASLRRGSDRHYPPDRTAFACSTTWPCGTRHAPRRRNRPDRRTQLNCLRP